jgi:hypothetical protein
MRYAQASNGQVSYGSESTAYSKASDTNTYFGLVNDDVEIANPNEVTPMAGGPRRGPHVNSPDAKTYEFEIPFLVLDSNAPFEYALGDRTTTSKDPDGTSGSGDEYDEHLITEADRLPTMTVEHQQSDIDLKEWFVGSKANLQLEAEQGEALSATMNVVGAKHEYDDSASSDTALNIPSNRSPFRFWMAGDVSLSNPSDGSTVDTVATVTGLDLSWDNGLEAQHHGDGREAYAVAETTAAEKYDMSVTANVEDASLYKRAADAKAPVDVEIPFYRDPGAADITDALYIRLNECTVTSAPIPDASEGTIEAEIGLAPRETEIEIRQPQ